MQETILTDFHGGWMIEIFAVEGGFQALCRSPQGQVMLGHGRYPQAMPAWQGAIQQIDRLAACASLKGFLRELYEVGRIEFEHWQHLSQSLD